MLIALLITIVAVIPVVITLDLSDEKTSNRVAGALIRLGGGKNGELTQEQFNNAIEMASGGAFGIKGVRIDFQDLDTDGTGTLNKTELVNFLQQPEGDEEVNVEYLKKHVDEERLTSFGKKAYDDMHKQVCINGEAAQSFEDFQKCETNCTVLQCKIGIDEKKVSEVSKEELEDLRATQRGLITGSVFMMITTITAVTFAVLFFLAMFTAPIYALSFTLAAGLSVVGIIGTHFLLKQIRINSRKIEDVEL